MAELKHRLAIGTIVYLSPFHRTRNRNLARIRKYVTVSRSNYRCHRGNIRRIIVIRNSSSRRITNRPCFRQCREFRRGRPSDLHRPRLERRPLRHCGRKRRGCLFQAATVHITFLRLSPMRTWRRRAKARFRDSEGCRAEPSSLHRSSRQAWPKRSCANRRSCACRRAQR